MMLMTLTMASSFITVASGYIAGSVGLMLVGIAIGSFQSGLGEASFLALAAFYDGRLALTAWSSGTGFAGIFGFAWVVFFTEGLKLNFSIALYFALILTGLFAGNCFILLKLPELDREQEDNVHREDNCSDTDPSMVMSPIAEKFEVGSSSIATDKDEEPGEDTEEYKTSTMTLKERIDATLALWPYMIPLFVVYFAEYLMQSGVWSAFGFPITSTSARNKFYQFSNWTYQAGVLCSRSSGMIWKADIRHLWIMPVMQVAILLFFLLDAYYLWWNDWSILIVCFVVGLLGGAVYVNGFSLISEKVKEELREFSLSAASIADSCGIVASTLISIAIQKSIYDYHDISDDDS